MGKKFELKHFTTPYDILHGLLEKYATIDEYVRYLEIPKQNVSYWLKKLEKEGLATKVSHGIYEITWAGKNILNTYEEEKGKEKICLENMRYKYPIHEGLEKLVKAVWLKMNDMNNIKVYRGKFEGFTIAVYAGSENPSLEITCPKRIGVNIYEMMYDARCDVETIGKWIAGEYGLKLGMCEPSMEPEWAIPNPMAETILNLTQSSQIRTPKGTINRSKGRNADLETRDIRLAHEILMMPKTINEIRNEISKIKVMMIGKQQIPEFYNN